MTTRLAMSGIGIPTVDCVNRQLESDYVHVNNTVRTDMGMMFEFR